MENIGESSKLADFEDESGDEVSHKVIYLKLLKASTRLTKGIDLTNTHLQKLV